MIRVCACAALWTLVADATAGGHRDRSVIPLGSFRLAPGTQQIRVARPYDYAGLIDAPLVLVALFNPRGQAGPPIEINFATEQRTYPVWKIDRPGQTYVIGLRALNQDCVPDESRLALSVSVKDNVPGLALMASGAPDVRLAGDAALGPLEDVVRHLPRSAAREYLTATVAAAAGDLARARRGLIRLASGSDEHVAVFARAALRRIRFAEAEAVMQYDFATHYRFGLYAQQCGLFRAARLHFEQAIRADDGHPDAWFRLGEMMERCGDPLDDVAAVMARAGQAAGVRPNTWDVLVVLLRSEHYFDVQDGREVELRAEMTRTQAENIRRQWQRVEQMIYGATGGRLRLNTRFIEVADETPRPYTADYCGVLGPPAELVPARGSYDSVISFRPRGQAQTVGADCGPHGAGLSDIGVRAGWDVCLREWTRQLDWTLRASEAAKLFPIAEQAVGCGHSPAPSLGYAVRAALRYYVPPNVCRTVQTADPDPGAGYVHAWFVSDPTKPTGDEVADGNVVRCYGPMRTEDWPRRLARTSTEFLDLRQLYADAAVPLPARAVTAATAYVRSPITQPVRVWLGFNDGLALWLNGRPLRRGDYYAVNRLADRNAADMLATAATLQKGWNRFDVAVEAWPVPFNEGFGFCIRICDFENRPVTDLRVAERERDVPAMIAPDTLVPRPGSLYRWDEVRDDIHGRLPRLSAAWLSEYATLPAGFQVQGAVDTAHGFVSLAAPDDRDGTRRGGATLRAPLSEWDPQRQRDSRLNNLMDWNREFVAVYPFTHPSGLRHLLVMRPEAVEAFLTCLREAPQAAQVFGLAPVRNRILGYLRVGPDTAPRDLIVAETLLPTPLPADEEDLLTPLP